MSAVKKLPLLLVLLFTLLLPGRPAEAANCGNISVGLTPLSEVAIYQGFPGGLYPGGNDIPANHLVYGLLAGEAVERLDPAGNPDPAGRIVLLSVGMSNTRQEYQAFIRMVTQRPAGLALINGARAGYDAPAIADPNSDYWPYIDAVLAGRGLTPAQVQVVWLKEATALESSVFPADAQELQAYLRSTVLIIGDRYPNVRQVFISSRIYAGYAVAWAASIEPWAYQGAYAVKWLIEAQITGGDPALAYAVAPWLAWGPYFWADGLTPRADGLTWSCPELEADGMHPSAKGEAKVAGMLLEFFRSHPAAGWFTGQ